MPFCGERPTLHRMRLSVGTKCSLLLLVTAGCSATVVDEGDAADGSEQAPQASVAVERTTFVPPDSASPQDRARSHVSALFMKVFGGLDHELAHQVIGSTDPSELEAPTGCRSREQPASPPLVEDFGGTIELVDVGDMILRIDAQAMPLAARAFPDVGDIVSGLIYTSRDDSSDLPAGGTYVFESSGSAVMESFVLQAEAPSPPEDVKLGGQQLSSDEAAVSAGEPLAISWEPGDGGDRIVVQLDQPSQQDFTPLRCVFLDDSGGGSVPAHLMDLQPGAEVEVAVHRLRRVEVSYKPAAHGSEPHRAVVDFDFATVGHAAVVTAD